MELEKRLGLYQVFLKLYEHKPDLLDDILQLENTASQSLRGKGFTYVQGMIQGEQAYLMTNLLDGRTQRFFQPQGIWVMGRDRHVALAIRDQWLSRRHAAIQYIENEGFYLVDLNSTNGSFVNGEPIMQRQLLQDGDQIRLGTLTISFFICQTAQILKPEPLEVLAQIQNQSSSPSQATAFENLESINTQDISPSDDELQNTSLFFKEKLLLEKPNKADVSLPKLNTSQQSEILDRFFNRQIPTE